MVVDDNNPYVGLRPFSRDDSLYFFGRHTQTTALLESLGHHRFLGVVGSSGCGKSSLIRAGLMPALLAGFLVKERDAWFVAEMKPGDAPLRHLAEALISGVRPDDDAPDAVEALSHAIAQEHVQAVIDYVRPVLGERGNLLVLVDQFEEIFAYAGAGDDAAVSALTKTERARRRAVAAHFVDVLLKSVEQAATPLYCVLTMRTDYLGDCDLFYGLPEAMNRGRYLVPRLTREQLRDVIEGPALLHGMEMAPRLVDALLNELEDRTDRLPVLQHALQRTWACWQRASAAETVDRPRSPAAAEVVDLPHYRAAGGLDHALARHADQALAECEASSARRVLQCVTDTDALHRRRRRRATVSELVEVTQLTRDEVEAVLGCFGRRDRQFVTITSAGEPQVEVTHESMIRGWHVLRNWVDDERDARGRFFELIRDARDWRREAEPRRDLLRGAKLTTAIEWRDRVRPSPAWARRHGRTEADLRLVLRYLLRSAAGRVHRTMAVRLLRGGLVVGVVVLLGAVTQATFDRALHVPMGFVRPGAPASLAVVELFISGVRSLATSVLIAVFELLAVAGVWLTIRVGRWLCPRIVEQTVIRPCSRLRWAIMSAESSLVAAAFLLVAATVGAGVAWVWWDVLTTIEQLIGAPVTERVDTTILGPAGRTYRDFCLIVASSALLGLSAGWLAFVVPMQSKARASPALLTLTWIGAAVIVVIAAMTVAPWKLIWNSESEAVSLGGQPAFIVGERDRSLFLYLPDGTPRHVIVDVGDPDLDRDLRAVPRDLFR